MVVKFGRIDFSTIYVFRLFNQGKIRIIYNLEDRKCKILPMFSKERKKGGISEIMATTVLTVTIHPPSNCRQIHWIYREKKGCSVWSVCERENWRINGKGKNVWWNGGDKERAMEVRRRWSFDEACQEIRTQRLELHSIQRPSSTHWKILSSSLGQQTQTQSQKVPPSITFSFQIHQHRVSFIQFPIFFLSFSLANFENWSDNRLW